MSETREGIIFELGSALYKRIRHTETQWQHIHKRQELRNQLDNMKETLSSPDAVYYVPREATYHYYRLYSRTPVGRKHLLVIVRHLNGEGFVITCFYARRISKPEKVLLYESLSQKPR